MLIDDRSGHFPLFDHLLAHPISMIMKKLDCRAPLFVKILFETPVELHSFSDRFEELNLFEIFLLLLFILFLLILERIDPGLYDGNFVLGIFDLPANEIHFLVLQRSDRRQRAVLTTALGLLMLPSRTNWFHVHVRTILPDH